MKFAVSTKFYSTGRVVKNGPAQVPDGSKPSSRETASCDVYIDIFETYQEAKKFQAQKA